ncbi:hypothetical protein CRE_15896 [Caenorhabditis remanei]|uniref:Uncharacterized protein n=1 Tax=Caenorhabditis remanei TaxID=31234 RepID=E3MBE5_CAERE|nr:hypothetical protein CRE_15896 [Caenorhabditis remanei]
MSKSDEEIVKEEPKDEQTAKHLHKLAETGKEQGLPACIVAHYEKKAWEATKSGEKFTSCEKCGMPPPAPLDSAKKIESDLSKTCATCDHVNKKAIGTESELAEQAKKEEILKKQEERPVLKRKSDERRRPAYPNRRMYSPVRMLARKVTPQCGPPKNYQRPIKKTKLVEEKEPEFLQQLFGIGAKEA